MSDIGPRPRQRRRAIERSIRKNALSQSSRTSLKDAREAGNTQEQIDLLLDALDVIEEDADGYYYILDPSLIDTAPSGTQVVKKDGVRLLVEK